MEMATANNCRNKDLTPEEFDVMCHDYLCIHNPINNPLFFQSEAETLLECLKTQTNGIPEDYLSLDFIKASCSELFIVRGLRAQHRAYQTNIEELHRTFYIFSKLDTEMKGAASAACKKVFGVEPLHFIRSAFVLYTLGNDIGRNGHINFKNMSCDQGIIDTWAVDQETCRIVASKISYDEKQLREEWYNKEMLAGHELYQQYSPDPLYKYPIIHLNGIESQMQFLMPSPAIFLRSLTNAWFSQLITQNGTLGNKLGNVLENHVQQSIEHIFGKEHVSKIPVLDNKKSADFYIKLDECDLIIEMKSRLGSDEAQSLMKPEHVAKIWSRLYRACEQCAASIQEYKGSKNPIIAIVLIGDHMTAEAIPFQSFAERSGLFKNMGIDAIEFLSWNALEYCLAHTSVNKFVRSLVNKWKSEKAMNLGDVMSLDMERDTPAHHYEYLKDAKLHIFGKRFLPD